MEKLFSASLVFFLIHGLAAFEPMVNNREKKGRATPQDTFQEIELGPIMITLQPTSGGGP